VADKNILDLARELPKLPDDALTSMLCDIEQNPEGFLGHVGEQHGKSFLSELKAEINRRAAVDGQGNVVRMNRKDRRAQEAQRRRKSRRLKR
jgi:hypothetical protein